MDPRAVQGAKAPRMRFTRYSEERLRYSDKGGRSGEPEALQAQVSSHQTGAVPPRNNVDYPEGIKWIVRLKVGLCAIYGLLIAGAAVALVLPVPAELQKGQLWGMALGLLVFGVFEGLEAWGLKQRALWGSYLTMGRTVLMLPGGLYLMLMQTEPLMEGLLLVANLLMVFYLVRDVPRLKRR